MKQIILKITSLSPLAIAQKKPGSVSEALDHIPGSVIRGAIAAQVLQQLESEFRQFTQEDGDFPTLFLSDDAAIFQNAYPAVAKIGDNLRAVDEAIMVLPATAVSSKTDPGFLGKGNGVFDTLIDRFCAETFNTPYEPNCPKDSGRVEPFSGFYSVGVGCDGKTPLYRSHSTTTRFLTRVGINRRRATSQEEILYSIEVLNESFLENSKSQDKNWHYYTYRSSILVQDESIAQRLTDFINLNRNIFRLGGSTSRGLGKVQITANLSDVDNTVENRITKFNEKIKERWQVYQSIFGNSYSLDNRLFFTLDLQSDAILSEDWQRTTVVSEEMLQEFTGIQDKSLKLEVSYSSYDYRSGWNSAWQLMKDVELVTNRGAVYLFSTSNNNLWKQWINELQKLENKGMGERVTEGFGQVKICNEFH